MSLPPISTKKSGSADHVEEEFAMEELLVAAMSDVAAFNDRWSSLLAHCAAKPGELDHSRLRSHLERMCEMDGEDPAGFFFQLICQAEQPGPLACLRLVGHGTPPDVLIPITADAVSRLALFQRDRAWTAALRALPSECVRALCSTALPRNLHKDAPLHALCRRRHPNVDAIKALIAALSDVEGGEVDVVRTALLARNGDNATPLHLVARFGSGINARSVALLLLQHGADAAAIWDGHTAMECATSTFVREALAARTSIPVVGSTRGGMEALRASRTGTVAPDVLKALDSTADPTTLDRTLMTPGGIHRPAPLPRVEEMRPRRVLSPEELEGLVSRMGAHAERRQQWTERQYEESHARFLASQYRKSEPNDEAAAEEARQRLYNPEYLQQLAERREEAKAAEREAFEAAGRFARTRAALRRGVAGDEDEEAEVPEPREPLTAEEQDASGQRMCNEAMARKKENLTILAAKFAPPSPSNRKHEKETQEAMAARLHDESTRHAVSSHERLFATYVSSRQQPKKTISVEYERELASRLSTKG